MADLINVWVTYIAQWIQIIPKNGWAIILSVLITSVAVQWLKVTFSDLLIHKWVQYESTYNLVIRFFALILGFVICYSLWPEDEYRIWTSLLSGLISPTLYAWTMILVYKKWPVLANRMSGDPQNKLKEDK